MSQKTVLAFSGSLREKSYNTDLLHAFAEQAPEGVTLEVVNYADVQLYNQDDEANFPAVVTALKQKIEAADAILFATPEYNRSVPGVLKNMIDWTSRPWGQNSWKGKPVYIAGASVGPQGTAVGQSDLKKILVYLDMQVIGQPEFYLGTAHSKFDESGKLIDEDTKAHIKGGWEVILARI